MEWTNVIAIIMTLAFFAILAFWYKDKADGSLFIEGLTKLIGLIINAEKQIQGSKMGDSRMVHVVESAERILTTPELKIVSKKGGIAKVAQTAFDILKTLGTLGLLKK